MPDEIENLQARGRDEPVAAFLGMKLLALAYGYAQVSIQVRPEFINFNGMAFGGIISCVADQAFAYATNSVISPNVASQFNIHFISAVQAGDELIAECRVLKSGRRVCISEIKVTGKDGRAVAMATGTTIPVREE